MRYLSILLVMSMCAVMQAVTPIRTVLLYPNGAPDSNGYAPEDEYVKEGTKFFRTSVPRLDLYVPASATAQSPCPVLLVCPGGGYSFTSTGNEGIDVATVSSALGHSAISTTTSIYLHAFQDANARASEAIANVLDFTKKETPPPDQDGREKKIQLIRTSYGQKASSGQ